jgi:hypothetical protein
VRLPASRARSSAALAAYRLSICRDSHPARRSRDWQMIFAHRESRESYGLLDISRFNEREILLDLLHCPARPYQAEQMLHRETMPTDTRLPSSCLARWRCSHRRPWCHCTVGASRLPASNTALARAWAQAVEQRGKRA